MTYLECKKSSNSKNICSTNLGNQSGVVTKEILGIKRIIEKLGKNSMNGLQGSKSSWAPISFECNPPLQAHHEVPKTSK
jgi:hypothetical protein